MKQNGIVTKEDVGKIAFIIFGPYKGLNGVIKRKTVVMGHKFSLEVASNKYIPLYRRNELYIIDPDITEAEGLKHMEVAKALCKRHQ